MPSQNNLNDLQWIENNKFSLVHHFSATKESFWQVVDCSGCVIGQGGSPFLAIECSKMVMLYNNRLQLTP